MTIEEELASAKAQVTELKDHVKALNDEAKGHRLNAKNARTEADAALADVARLREEQDTALKAAKAETDAAKAEVVKAQAEAADAAKNAMTAANNRVRDAELRVMANKAGMIDLDGLKMLDTSVVTVDDNGEVKIPADYFDNAKKAKPFLFGSQNTSSTSQTPPIVSPGQKSVKDMSEEEFNVHQRSLGVKI